jgi:hypothetical protein
LGRRLRFAPKRLPVLRFPELVESPRPPLTSSTV